MRGWGTKLKEGGREKTKMMIGDKDSGEGGIGKTGGLENRRREKSDRKRKENQKKKGGGQSCDLQTA